METSRTKNTARNTVFGTVNRCTNLVIPFFLRTLILQKIGYEYLGLGSLFTSIIQVLNLSELGLGNALVFRMYKPVAENDENQIDSLLFLYKKAYHIIGTIISILGLVLLPLLPYLIDFNQVTAKNINVSALFLIYLANTVITYLLFAYKKSVLIAYQRTDVISVIDCITHTVMYIIQAALLFFIPNYYVYILLLPIFTLIDNTCISILVDKKFPFLGNKSNKNSIKLATVFTDIKYIVGHKLGGVIITSSDSIVISAFLDLVLLTKYSNYHYIITALTGFLSVGYTAVLSSVGNTIVKETKEKILSLYYELSFCTFVFVGFCSSCLVSLYQPFMRLWLGEAYMFDMKTVIVFVVYFYTWQVRLMGLNFKDAAGMWKADFLKPYVGMIFNIVLNIVLVHFFGIIGVLFASIFVFLCIYFPWENYVLFKFLFSANIYRFLLKQASYVLITVFTAAVVFFINKHIFLKNALGSVAAKFLLTIFLSALILVASTCWTYEFKQIVLRIQRFFSRHKN